MAGPLPIPDLNLNIATPSSATGAPNTQTGRFGDFQVGRGTNGLAVGLGIAALAILAAFLFRKG